MLAIILLAGIALVLSTGTAGHLMDDSQYDGLLVAVWAFIAGSLSGILAYFVLGALLYGAVKLLGSQGTYRRSRHVVAFAAVPIVLSLVLWPIRLALYGEDVFRTGGSDAGTGARLFELLGARVPRLVARAARDRRAGRPRLDVGARLCRDRARRGRPGRGRDRPARALTAGAGGTSAAAGAPTRRPTTPPG